MSPWARSRAHAFLPSFVRIIHHSIVSQATSTVNITTFCASSNMAGSRPKPTTFSSATTSTEESSHLKPSVFSLPTRSNIPKTSSSCAATTNVPVSTGYMAFMTNVRPPFVLHPTDGLSIVSTLRDLTIHLHCVIQANADTTLNYGKRSPTASTACPLLLLSTRRSSRCTAA